MVHENLYLFYVKNEYLLIDLTSLEWVEVLGSDMRKL
jgi:hypothetical protein